MVARRGEALNYLEQISDDELLKRYAARNDREALGALFRRHADSAYSTALRVCRNSADAEDAVQGAFIKVMQTAGNFRGGGEHAVRFWIMKIVVGTCKNAIRSHVSRRRREELVVEEQDKVVLPDEAQGAEDNLRERSAEVLHALDGLPEQFRTAIWLHHYLGMSLKDTAEAAGVPERTLESRLYRGMQMLRDALAASGISTSVASLGVAVQFLPTDAAPASLANAVSKLVSLTAGMHAGSSAATGSGLSLIKPIAVGLAVVSIAGTGGYLVLNKTTEKPVAPLTAVTPPATKEGYVDGQIILQDGFENGLDHWNTGIMSGNTREAMVKEDPVMAAKCVRVEDSDVRGKRSKALVISAPGITTTGKAGGLRKAP
jgi:RNA polymerase sigma factor (sigma-70 family)